MNEFSFKQNDQKSGIPFAILYLILVFSFFYIRYNGMMGMANALESLGSNKIKFVFFIAVFVLFPFVFIYQLLMPRFKVKFLDSGIEIDQGRSNIKRIPFSEIPKMHLNRIKINYLELYNEADQVIFTFFPQNNNAIIENLIQKLNENIGFKIQKGEKKHFGNLIPTAMYTRK